MRFEMLLTENANRDLEEIYSYVAEHDTPGKAEDLIELSTASSRDEYTSI